jgi:DHA1 family tetracycline resistance protein-like MFS transporter
MLKLPNTILKNIKKYEYTNLIPLLISTFIDIIGFSILMPYLPSFTKDFGASLFEVGLLLSANSFFSLFGNIIWGSLSDKYGRKPILLICQFGTMAGFVIMAFSTTLAMLFVSRIVDGIFGGNYPITKAVVGDIVAPKHRSKQMSNIGVAWTVGNLIGPGIGALLSGFGIMGPGLFGAGLSVITILITIYIFKESNPRLNRNASAAEMSAFKKKKAISFSLLKERDPRLLLIQGLFNTIPFFIFITTVSIFAAQRFDLSVGDIGWMITSIGLVKLLVRFLIFSPMLKQFGDKKTILIGFLTFVGAYTWMIFLNNLWEYMIVLVLVGFGAACTLDVLTGMMSKSVGKDRQGEMMGLQTATGNISQILGPTVGSYLISLPNTYLYGLSTAIFSMITLVLSFIPLQIKSDASE